MNLYVIGSLRNSIIPSIANQLREAGHQVFDDWYAAGPEADDYWQKYETQRGRSYIEALAGAAAKNVFQFDKRNLDQADGAILVLPAGKSGHLELGYMAGRGKYTAVLFEGEPDRWDVMYQFASGIFTDVPSLLGALPSPTEQPRFFPSGGLIKPAHEVVSPGDKPR